MACNHKFQKYLSLSKLDFVPITLIVGTFNPVWPNENEAEWFYGRTKNNNFWDLLPRVYKQKSLINSSQQKWKAFCKEKKIAITDLIECINDANENNLEDVKLLSTFSDKSITTKFKDFKFIKIVELLKQNTEIKNVYFTRGATDNFWKKLWKPVEQYCNGNGITTKTLITPSGYAYYSRENTTN